MAEAVGLALSIIPLLLAAIEHYEDILQPIRRYRQYATKVRRLCDEIEVERTIFLTECQLLLATASCRKITPAMLDDSNHPTWTEDTFRDSLSHQLGSLGPNCKAIMIQIKEKLTQIRKVLEKWSSVGLPANGDCTITSKHWRRTKILLFGDGVAEDYRRAPAIESVFSDLVRPGGREVQSDKKASQELFQSFAHACAAHSEYLVQLSLNTTCDYGDKQSPSHRMNFHFALGQPRSLPASMSTINTACENSSRSPVVRNAWFEVETYTIELQRRLPHFGNRSAGPSVDVSEQLHNLSLTSANPGGTHIEIYRTRDFCAQVGLLYQSRPHENSANPWVAVLGQSSTHTHLIRGPSHFANAKCPTLPISLDELIQSSNSSADHQLPLFYRLRLAKSVAITVLQLHSTCWLPAPLHSEDMHLFESPCGSSHQRVGASLPLSPFIKVLIKSSTDEQSLRPLLTIRPVQPSGVSIIPNPFLFHLGVDGYRSSGPISEFLMARHLAHHVGTYVGGDFAVIVRKCLRCDFGYGEDLQDTLLQARVYEDVVCRLQQLEETFRKVEDLEA
ncbi:hypothetical protein BDV23DRAFT_179589 [Aspergillus alliaceus]|uniref:Fungal N-terminal domain-containing protein n=1 Tax=Petromyces alliaceus TaxID=209559 RepID=A0A5N7CK05_PETAA|nr:hypothetical protein BDV23DRAFT_179589 [Aspergillus alliaceus]